MCSNEIAFKTDPQNQDYVCESGATRNFESWRQQSDKEKVFEDERKEGADANVMAALDLPRHAVLRHVARLWGGDAAAVTRRLDVPLPRAAGALAMVVRKIEARVATQRGVLRTFDE